MDFVSLCKQLAIAAETMMNDAGEQQQRTEAYKFCEEFKESSPLCIQCGIQLARFGTSPSVRHFGLHLIEHSIKYRWNDLSLDEKIYIKVNSLELIANNKQEHLDFIKNAFSKIIVEIIKREWPQQWPNLLDEFSKLCSHGEEQTEIVLLTLLRLSEDVVTLDSNVTIQQNRRRELHQALLSHMDAIFKFLLQFLCKYKNEFTQMEDMNGAVEKQKVAAYGRVAQSVLKTLTGFVEWIPVNHLMDFDGLLLKTLCLLLSNDELQLAAAECLLQIVNRKGKLEDRRPLLVLFNTEHMNAIFDAANKASQSPLQENHYIFLKHLCQVLIGIGNQTCALWGTVNDVNQPENFRIFLDAILAFTRHPSQVLNNFTFSLWISFFRHKHISNNDVLLSFIPHITEVARLKLIKVGYPTRRDSPSCEYSYMDFESDDEFNQFFPKYRADVAETLRMATVLNPMITFRYGAKWLEEQLKKSVDAGDGTEIGLCNLSSPAFLEWDALSVFLECVLGKIFQADYEPKPTADEGIKLLKAVLYYETQDPLVLSCSLSCISALFVFLTLVPETLPAVLNKIFSTLVFSLPGQTKATRSKAVKNVRRHACSSLVKICKQYPSLLKSSFDDIYMHFKKLSVDPEQLSQMEKCTLIEALILISNQYYNFEQQSLFIKELLLPVAEMWLNEETRHKFQTTSSFMSYIGIDRTPVEPSNDDVVGINRSQIIMCLNMILAIIKRSTWPEEMSAAKHGGFFKEPNSALSSQVLCNPATNYILPLLENVLLLQRCFNQMWHPSAMSKVSPEYSGAYDMLDIDKNNILGINPPCVDATDIPNTKQPLERMKHFLTLVHDTSYHIMGNAGPSLGVEFYELPKLADCIKGYILDSIIFIPDYRLRPIIRVFMKPFVQSCPPEYYCTTLIPILTELSPYMLERLNNNWLSLMQRFENSNLSEEERSQEVLEDQLNRQLTREYIDLLGAILHGKRNTVEMGDMKSDLMEDDEQTCSSVLSDNLSELGQLVLKHESLQPSIIMCCFIALSWNDTTSCNKALQLCTPVLKQIAGGGLNVSSDQAKYIIFYILAGLHQHGQHEHNQSLLLTLGLQAYETLRPIHSCILNVIVEITSCKPEELQAFDEKLYQTASKQISEKKKKEMLKNIVRNIIGKNVGQVFRKEVHIKNLPPLVHPSKPKPPSLIDSTDTDIGLCILFEKKHVRNDVYTS